MPMTITYLFNAIRNQGGDKRRKKSLRNNLNENLSKNVLAISARGVRDADWDGLAQTAAIAIAMARICNAAVLSRPRPHARAKIVNTF